MEGNAFVYPSNRNNYFTDPFIKFAKFSIKQNPVTNFLIDCN